MRHSPERCMRTDRHYRSWASPWTGWHQAPTRFEQLEFIDLLPPVQSLMKKMQPGMLQQRQSVPCAEIGL